jgi:hypothetical protein
MLPFLILGALGLAVVRKATAAPVVAPDVVSQAELDWIPEPQQDAAYWALVSGGPPSAAGSRGAGEVTPTVKMIPRISSLFPGERFAWDAPNAGTGLFRVPSFAPPGATITPGPVPPAQPTPQSAVEPSSPWLPDDLRLVAPLAANPWFFELSASDPFAAVASGGFIDVEAVAADPAQKA